MSSLRTLLSTLTGVKLLESLRFLVPGVPVDCCISKGACCNLACIYIQRLGTVVAMGFGAHTMREEPHLTPGIWYAHDGQASTDTLEKESG